MGVGFFGSDKELLKMAVKEGHPDPKSVKNIGELINWIADKKGQKQTQTRPK